MGVDWHGWHVFHTARHGRIERFERFPGTALSADGHGAVGPLDRCRVHFIIVRVGQVSIAFTLLQIDWLDVKVGTGNRIHVGRCKRLRCAMRRLHILINNRMR